VYKWNALKSSSLDAKISQVRQQLIRKFGLNTEKKARPIVRAEDEFALLKTLWCSSELAFDHERYRIQLALLLQLAGITGSRPDALLKLTWGDVKVVLLRDPSGGTRARLVVELTFNHTKGYLGAKDP
jgi:integrase